MPEATMLEEAKKQFRQLPDAVQNKLADRFSDLMSVVSRVAQKLERNVPFPKALLSAVREKDPALANQIKGMLPQKPETKKEAKTEDKHKPQLSVSAGGGYMTGRGGVGRVSAELKTGPVTAEVSAYMLGRKADAGARLSASLLDDRLNLSLYRDPTLGVTAGAGATYYFQLGKSPFYMGTGGEAGFAGKKIYGAAYVPFLYEGGKFKAEFTPQVLVMQAGRQPDVSGALQLDVEYNVTRSLSITGRVYVYDLQLGIKPGVATTAGLKFRIF